ncbi:MAG: hypothetical protein ACRDT6_05235 [Micromonosporaceae bacterium]
MQLTYPLAAAALIAVTLGFTTGVLFADTRRAWKDLRLAKAQVPTLRAAARLLSAKAVGWVVVSTLVAAWSLYTLAAKGT